jgi:L-alanine-DL-glutamate epimerase-like enolase superfamily enzyme
MRDDSDIERELHTAEVDLEIRIAQLKHALVARVDEAKRTFDRIRNIPIAVADHVWPAMAIALAVGAAFGARR